MRGGKYHYDWFARLVYGHEHKLFYAALVFFASVAIWAAVK